MKCVVIVMCALTCTSLSEAKWCIRNITEHIDVTRIMLRTKMVKSSWYQPAQPKTETFREVQRIPQIKQKRECCEGYIPDDLHGCVPLCPNGCPKMADCVEPDVCKCHPGYHLEKDICRLDCGNCENGRCSDLGTCECNPKYVRIENECKPICGNKCTNGFCASPDKCECNLGYQENAETNHCEPICKQICGGNAYCSAPEVCSCKYGFFGNPLDVCQPWCKSECKNGQCVGPNNCACHQGFAKVDGLCMPDCQSGCQFGDCLDEGICRCWPDYVYNNSTRSCEEIKSTTATHSSTTRGSTKQTTTEEATPAPFCLNDCRNGSCIAGICHCNEGFIKADSSCLCQSCKAGDCIAESLCPHFLQMNVTPLNTEPTLTSTSELSTSETWTSESSTSESTTSESSTSESSTEISTVTQTTDCGRWSESGACLDNAYNCPDGLILNEENNCISICDATCKNGICTEDNLCQCRPGYLYVNGTECVPQCDKECVNSFCIDPNRCECREGYIAQLNPLLAHICLPKCNDLDGEEGCINGTCVAVNKCQCLEGFVHKPGNRFECMPTPIVMADKLHRSSWYIYLLLGLLILLVISILGLYALRKLHQDTYNVDKVEKSRGTVRYRNGEHQYCVI